jgi:hypothetical protein
LAETLLREGLRIAEQAVDVPGLRNGALFLAGVCSARGTLEEAEDLYRRALELGWRQGEWAWEAAVLTLLGQARYERGDAAGARARVVEALDICAVRDLPTSRGRALVLSGRLAVLAGDHPAGVEQLEEGLALLRTLGDQGALAYGHLLAAHADLDRGDDVAAARHLAALLVVTRDTHESLALVRGLEGVAELLAGADPARAVSLLGTAAGQRQELGFERVPLDQARLDRWLDDARSALGDDAARVEAAGAGRPLADALADALDACHVDR